MTQLATVKVKYGKTYMAHLICVQMGHQCNIEALEYEFTVRLEASGDKDRVTNVEFFHPSRDESYQVHVKFSAPDPVLGKEVILERLMQIDEDIAEAKRQDSLLKIIGK